MHDFRALVRRAAPWLARAESLARPRAAALTGPVMRRVVGAVSFVLAVILTLPIPFGNIPPAVAICLMALGILEGDGVWVAAGFTAAAIAGAIVAAVFFGVLETALFVGRRFLGV
jgi:hypothetical protein